MENFTYSLKTDVIFGKDCIQSLPETLKTYGKHVLMVYGGKSIHSTGLYDQIKDLLTDFEIKEVSGIQPNPSIEKVREGISVCKENQVDVVLAIGGGSVMDASKAIASGAMYEGDVWDFFTQKSTIENALPLVGIVTVAASGSELGNGAVISNPDTNEKMSADSEYIRFKTIYMDPVYTFTVPKKHTAAGSIDILSHLMEQYFTGNSNMLSKELVEGVMRTVINYAPIAYSDPENEEARAQLMWASSLENNGILSLGSSYSGWPCHAIEHELSAYHHVIHGTGLAIVTPNWMKYVLNDTTVQSFARFGRNVWNIQEENDMLCAQKAIDSLSDFYKKLESPLTLKEVNVGDDHFEEMAEEAVKNGYLEYAWVPLNEKDVCNILKMCL